MTKWKVKMQFATHMSKITLPRRNHKVLINHLKISSHKEAFKQYNDMKERENRNRPFSSSQANVTPAKQAKVDSFFGKTSSFNVKKVKK